MGVPESLAERERPHLSTADSTSVPTWEEVAYSHGRFLYSLAYRLCGNHHDAQDLVQEVLLRVRRGLATYKPGNFEGWLSRITTNTFLDRVRKQKRRPTVPLPEEPDRVIAGTPDLETEIAARDLPDHLQALLADLAPEYRAAVVLKDVIGFSYEEIAEQLDIPVGTVRSRIHRGRRRLRQALEPSS
ncbi:MAG: sigma-70 family RNA polymerase sigma factor [Acidimicrobiia bacterium]|nr:sigma-70 family RNA polymerase sigma factor [Acidimicrobiia bacterium]